MKALVAVGAAVVCALGCGLSVDTKPRLAVEQTTSQQEAAEAAGTASASSTSQATEIDVPLPDDSDGPVAVAAAVFPQSVAPGEVVTLAVRAKIDQPWHIYAAGPATGPTVPTKLAAQLPDGIIPDGDWTLPDPETTFALHGPISVYHGDVRFTRRLLVSDSASPGNTTISCEFSYQACDPSRCLSPTTTKLAVPLRIQDR